MGIEVERKFLVHGTSWSDQADTGRHIRQAYVVTDPAVSVRIRIDGEDRSLLTVKMPNRGFTRLEFEYPIPLSDAEEMILACGTGVIEKRRYRLPAGDGLTWEVDRFEGANEGLVIAEIELEHEEQAFERPSWLGQEVTEDQRFQNAYLFRHPFKSWPEVAREHDTPTSA